MLPDPAQSYTQLLGMYETRRPSQALMSLLGMQPDLPDVPVLPQCPTMTQDMRMFV
jgi:hypothetical protein